MVIDDPIYRERIKRLEELTSRLSGPPLNPLPSTVEYSVEAGFSFGWACFNDDKVNVQRNVISKDAIFPVHDHEANEWLIVYEGKLKVMYHDTEATIDEGESIMFPAGCPHSVIALENTRLLGITVPPARGYPNVDD